MAPAAQPAQRSKASPIARLPPEVFFGIFRRLDARDLHHVSLVSKTWRNIATDNRLWEMHYWAFYRPISALKTTSELYVKERRDEKRRAAMLDWYQKTASSPPSSELFHVRPHLVWLAKKQYEEIKVKPRAPDICKKAHQKAIRAARDKYEYFMYCYDPEPTSSSRPLLPPPFLDVRPETETASDSSSDATPSSFHRLFASRMNADEELMRDLQHHVDLKCGTLHDLRKLLDTYNHGSSSLWAALCATQAIRDTSVERFLPTVDDKDVPWPRAFEIHSTAAQYKNTPHVTQHLALHHVALKALGHLQRWGAVLGMQDLQDRSKAFCAQASEDLKARIEVCGPGVEEAMGMVALFRSAETGDICEYLDLLALFVAAELEAQDRAGKPKYAEYGPLADPQSLPAGSTRHRLARIVSLLHSLGYGVARGQDASDFDNAFINLALYIPSQRLTSPLTLAAIVCAVARRLGIAATISNISSRVIIIAAEDSDKPAAWRRGGDEKAEWHRFFVDAAGGDGKFISGRKGHFVCEANEVEQFVHAEGGERSETAFQLEPASPLKVLQRVADDISRFLRADRGEVVRYKGSESYEGEDDAIALGAYREPLGSLRLFLEGRVGRPPAPLLLPTPASSLAPLPSTQKHGMRADPTRLGQDTEYCVAWIHRIVAPQQAGGLVKATDAVARMIGPNTTSSMYSCDYRMLIRADKRRKGKEAIVGKELVPRTGDDSSDDEEDELAFQDNDEERSPRAPKFFIKHIIPLLEDDEKRGLGLGGAGSGQMADRRDRPERTSLPRRLCDRAYPSNKDVKFGVGTVISHKQRDWQAVILGWDSQCNRCDHWIQERGVDSLPGGRFQPFYLCVTESNDEVYIPQCHVVPVRIPTGSTRGQAIDLLIDCVRCFEAPALGRAFRALRVAPWDEAAVSTEKGKVLVSKSKAKKMQRKEEKLKKKQKAAGQQVREKGQVYFELNAWMKEAWPYD